MSMEYFRGPHPEPIETDAFIRAQGFRPFDDGSTTLDYLPDDLIIRDCHPRNWIRVDGGLVPIDSVPEWAPAHEAEDR